MRPLERSMGIERGRLGVQMPAGMTPPPIRGRIGWKWHSAAGAPNTPPTVTLTAPSAGALFTAPATVNFSATASDPDGIANVGFYANGTLVGTATTSPFAFSWLNVGGGSYSLAAVATDSL